MRRIETEVRSDFQAKLESQGLSFHSWDNYWNESVYYQFNLQQIEEIEEATNQLHQMCLRAVDEIIKSNRLSQLGIPEPFHKAIAESWKRNEFSIYGRFDLAYDGINPPKMLEYNADTPTSLLESAVCQWYWMEDKFPSLDQFNSVHDKLVARWKELPGTEPVYVSSVADNEEDWVCATYMMDTILQAGREPKFITVEDIGWNESTGYFVDLDNNPIHYMFKLYPWEFMQREEFGPMVLETKTQFVEPLWKSVLSCKGLLPILWEMFPDHPNLLPATFEEGLLSSYAKKPLYSREGANIVLVKDGDVIAKDDGPYGEEGHIYQALYDMPKFDGKYPVIGSWVVNGESAGICIREDNKAITTNMSNFIPHCFTEN